MTTVYQNGFHLSTRFYSHILQAVTLLQLVKNALKGGVSQRELAHKIGCSHGTINNILAGSLPKNTPTLDKFATYFHVSLDSLRSAENNSLHEKVSPYNAVLRFTRLLDLAKSLDRDELDTLERCAEAFSVDDKEVRQHLIGQLKLVERLVRSERVTDGMQRKTTGNPK